MNRHTRDQQRADYIARALIQRPTETLNRFAGLLWTTLFAGIALGLILGWMLS